jgi:pimeloyl-ACP methyl ester carboxylesterase
MRSAIVRSAVRVDDAEIAYAVVGSGRSTLVMVMGLGARSTDWGEPFLSRLAEHHRLVVFDNRGTGTSSRTGPYTLDRLARDTVAVCEAVSTEPPHLLGISMGGMVAQHVALDHPGAIAKLVLVSTHCGGARAALPMPHVLPHLFPPPGMPAAIVVRNRLAAIAAPGFAERNPELLEHHVRLALAAPTPIRTYRAQVQAILESDRYRRLDEIEAPTLIVHGDADPLVPFTNAELLAGRIRDSRLVRLSGVGHLPMWEAPDDTADAVLAFLAA